MYFFDPNERDAKELAPGVITRTFWGDNQLLSIVELEPHSEVPNHTHPHEQGGLILEGELEMNIAGESRILKPGEGYVIPGGVEHYARSGDVPAKVLDIFAPVREEFKY